MYETKEYFQDSTITIKDLLKSLIQGYFNVYLNDLQNKKKDATIMTAYGVYDNKKEV